MKRLSCCKSTSCSQSDKRSGWQVENQLRWCICRLGRLCL
ncbi:MAG: hypothetical protein ACKOFA_05965 [Rhodoluna sp.]